jgi:hypothetical protein
MKKNKIAALLVIVAVGTFSIIPITTIIQPAQAYIDPTISESQKLQWQHLKMATMSMLYGGPTNQETGK